MTPSHTTSAGLTTAIPVLPVSTLNRLARERLESAFPLCWVSGEISNLTNASSGHVYFSLKDAAAQVRCVMFRNRAQLLGWRLENGQKIEARVLVTLYEARGDFQLNIETARKAGLGNLFEQFLRLKEKLEREGLFDGDAKRPLPRFPRRIGIISSPQAAALRDVLTTLSRRSPQTPLILYPTPVQGEGAAAQICRAIHLAEKRQECDVLIVCRGGGSLEDLWAFNDEELARAIRASAIPIITGIGHETDFTIADFASDCRAPTPTAAAELAAPEQALLRKKLIDCRKSLCNRFNESLNQRYQQLDWLANRLKHPAQDLLQQREHLLNLQRHLDNQLRQALMRRKNTLSALNQRLLVSRPDAQRFSRRLDSLSARLRHEWQTTFARKSTDLASLAASLKQLDPHSVLARGYSIVSDNTGKIINDSTNLEQNDRITVSFYRGRADATITAVSHDTPADTSR